MESNPNVPVLHPSGRRLCPVCDATLQVVSESERGATFACEDYGHRFNYSPVRSKWTRVYTSARCEVCGGWGEIVVYRNVEDGPMRTDSYRCDPCDGQGWMHEAAS